MDLEELENALTFIERKFGMDWLKDWVEKLKELDPERTTTGRYINLWGSGMSPVALMWFKCREQLAFHYLNGQLKSSPETLLLLGLVQDMKTVESVPGCQMRFDYLRDPAYYHKVAYEIHIAAGFICMGEKVSFTKNLGAFQLNSGKLKVVAYKNCTGNDNIEDYYKIPETLTSAGGSSASLYYIDFNMEPGETPEEGLKNRAQLLRKKITKKLFYNIVCTTTVIGEYSQGNFLVEKSIPLWEEDGGLALFLPDIERR